MAEGRAKRYHETTGDVHPDAFPLIGLYARNLPDNLVEYSVIFADVFEVPGNRDVMLRVIEVLRNSLDAEEIRLKTGRSLGAGERLSMLNSKQ
jgi:hypothetical protein